MTFHILVWDLRSSLNENVANPFETRDIKQNYLRFEPATDVFSHFTKDTFLLENFRDSKSNVSEFSTTLE